MSAGLLPFYQFVIVEDSKIQDYLLNPNHRDNGGKAQFFSSFGFAQSNWSDLASALKNHPITNPVARIVQTGLGTKYAVQGALVSPDGRNPNVTSVWIVDSSSPFPRLVTAYP